MRLSPALVALAGFAASAAGEEPELLPALLVSAPPLPAVAPAVDLTAAGGPGRPAGTLAEAGRAIPGLLVLESFGGFEPPRLSLRGSGLQSAPSSRGVRLLLDGSPLNLADGSFNSALLDASLCDQLDAWRGPDAWRTAPAVAGGALDFRARPAAEDGAATRVEAGSFGGWRAGAATELAEG